jgi:calcineurin-like phosphoesterase family protein
MKIKAFTSDTHYGHFNIIGYCDRPFYSIEHMTEALIENYNSVIGPEDNVVWVGDCFFLKRCIAKDIMAKLNGHKVLVRGNHDAGPSSIYYDLGFDLVVDTWLMLEIDQTPIRVCHFPYSSDTPEFNEQADKYARQRPPRVDGEILIHGHTHSKEKLVKNMIHVGVDAWNYKPAMYDEVVTLVKSIKEIKTDGI